MEKTLNNQNRENQEIYDRGLEGFLIYAKSMNASMIEKVKFLPYVKSGKILEQGCGNGAVLELLSNSFKSSTIYGTDISDTMLTFARSRNYQNKNVELLKANVKEQYFNDNSLDTIIYCSILHEVFSYTNYDHNAVRNTLKNSYYSLKKGGRIIIRDGVKEQQGDYYLSFNNEIVRKKFYKFAKEFGPHKIKYIEFNNKIKASKNDVMEFLSKYIYDTNWNIEVKEQFGVFTLDEYSQELEKIGFKILHKESYLIDWLRQTHYEKDFQIFEEKNNTLIETNFPHSTMILVGEKI